jgi:predicted CXXCH cytochrome family protein
MKKLGFILVFLSIISLGFGQITGSGHDFSGNAWSNTEICLPCHTPHNALAVTGAPLWNHMMSAVASYTLYTSPTFNGSTTIGQPGTQSKLCLSCHDGTVALENFGGTTTGTTFISGTFNVGSDLSNDHPIGFTYNAALATTDPGLWNPTTQPSGLGGTISADMLFTNQLECASCHDVHDNTHAPFLRMANTGSALCLTCHNK